MELEVAKSNIQPVLKVCGKGLHQYMGRRCDDCRRIRQDAYYQRHKEKHAIGMLKADYGTELLEAAIDYIKRTDQ